MSRCRYILLLFSSLAVLFYTRIFSSCINMKPWKEVASENNPPTCSSASQSPIKEAVCCSAQALTPKRYTSYHHLVIFQDVYVFVSLFLTEQDTLFRLLAL